MTVVATVLGANWQTLADAFGLGGIYALMAVGIGLVFGALQEIRERGLAILLVEQRAQRTVALADRSHVLSHGRLRVTLGPEAADDSDTLVSAYFS